MPILRMKKLSLEMLSSIFKFSHLEMNLELNLNLSESMIKCD